jgi:hypothetical protein
MPDYHPTVPVFQECPWPLNRIRKELLNPLLTKPLKTVAKVLVEPRDTFWGGYDYFADPDGHIPGKWHGRHAGDSINKEV